ncbi:hypothetical protein BOO29_09950 [Vibrio navarrensis]|uniref:Uncharacterized protein n=1 Tax=Vibrio navarrensis TaxID=29495 RepID=A0A099LSV2_9VIBR|nr:hypothetical protein [Vibrio navarrensis]KGK10531.1 hypothetical protein EA26_04070 [Vibrio navarrensis]MBE4572664.1 hypothetical protein [Vibrio navarrensis]MBE4585298.1 hypothetical protein [Vibrio navarrensis]MBE4614860.1 hypothetical protein [Vibrio navarrensis]QOD69508.1 hypothetical protein IF132_12020 [Vibrio navarrensis]
MMRQYQQGVATLLITSILLSVALVITLGSYKTLFYQIKRAQNEVKSRQDHWLAEGGLECLFTYVKEDVSRIVSVIPDDHTELDGICKNSLKLKKLYVSDLSSSTYRIHAKTQNDWSNLEKIFSKSTSKGKGAIQTTSRLTTFGQLNVKPDANGGPNEAGKYECVSITYKYSYTIKAPSSESKYITQRIDENALYAGSPAGDCTSNTTTNATVEKETSITKTDKPETSDSRLKDDFVYNSDADPFNSFFGYKKTPENIAKVKSSFPEAGRINITNAKNCKTVIENAFKYVDKVWLTGDCVIEGALSLPSKDSSGNDKNYTLVIQDGMFANFGSTVFQGSIFHLVDKSKEKFNSENINNYWDSLFYNKVVQGEHTSKVATTLQSAEQYITSGETVYVDAGSFYAVGGYGFDSDGLGVSIAGSMSLTFDSRKRPTSISNNIQWQEGSWNAQ